MLHTSLALQAPDRGAQFITVEKCCCSTIIDYLLNITGDNLDYYLGLMVIKSQVFNLILAHSKVHTLNNNPGIVVTTLLSGHYRSQFDRADVTFIGVGVM